MKTLKIIFAVVLSITFTLSQAAKIESDIEKLSYSMGVYFGQSVSQQGVELDNAAFLQAVKDVLDNAELQLSREELQKTLSAYQAKEQEELASAALSNKKSGEIFLAANKNKKGVETTESGLQYKVIKMGDGEKPTASNEVVVHYRGTLIDGTEFDSSYVRNEPVTFAVNQVIRGWQEALQIMPVGSKWQIYVPSELAYGERGASSLIKPNSTLIFDVELLEIK